MTESFLEQYFKSIATHLIEIQHEDIEGKHAFYRMADATDLDEFDDAVRNMGKFVCLLLELGNSDIGVWDSQKDQPVIGLHVLVKTTELHADKHAARDTAKTILLKIVSKMRIDAQITYLDDLKVIGPLKAAHISFSTKGKMQNMSAVDGNWYGKSLYFELTGALNLEYNPNDWTA